MKFAHYIVFAGGPLICISGLVMFRHPHAWAKANARLARKEPKEFNSLRQLEAIKRLGILLMVLGLFSLLCVLATDAILSSLAN